jgi:hypothetical protein
MHSGYCYIPTILLTGIAILASPSHLLSQQPGSALIVAAAVVLPEAPLPQQTPAGQSQVDSQPASNATHNPQAGHIIGTVLDVNGDIVPGATVVLEGPSPADRRTVVAKDNGFFEFENLKPEATYHITVSAKSFIRWISPAFVLTPGQYIYLKDIRLKIEGEQTTVTVYSTNEQIATEHDKA